MSEETVERAEKTPPPGKGWPAGLALEGGILCYRGVPVRDMIALPIRIAAFLIGRDRSTLWRAIAAGHLRSKNRMILRSEIDRWLSGAEAHRRPGRPRKSATP